MKNLTFRFRYASFLLLLLECGLRASETPALEVSDLRGSELNFSVRDEVHAHYSIEKSSKLATGETDWIFYPSVVAGNQFAAVAGPTGRVHVIGKEYCEIDLKGAKLRSEEFSDDGQGYMSFPPAIAVGNDGSIHLVTRHGEGSYEFDLRYRYRDPDGNWTRDYQYGSLSKRNYVVGVAAADDGSVALMHTIAGANVWGNVHLFSGGEKGAAERGFIWGIWRADNDARLRAYGDTIYLIAGLNDSNGKASYSWGKAGSGMVDEMKSNMKTHQGGSGRRGLPDLTIDGDGVSHLCYGAAETVMYNRYSKEGTKVFEVDREIFSETGDYHLRLGMSAIAVSDDGNIVMAVALKTPESNESGWGSDILYSYSKDGGNTWVEQEALGLSTHAGEGRARPVLCAVGDSFVLLYNDLTNRDISMGVKHF